jgi:hypothetical protein
MSSGKTRQHDPSQIIVNIGGRDASGFAKGSFVEIDRYAEAVALDIGSDGEATRIISANKSGFFKMVFQQSSPMNDYLSSLATSDERTKTAVVPVLVRDMNGTTIASAKAAWVKKKAKTDFADTAENREWTLDTGYLSLDVGGQNEI